MMHETIVMMHGTIVMMHGTIVMMHETMNVKKKRKELPAVCLVSLMLSPCRARRKL